MIILNSSDAKILSKELALAAEEAEDHKYGQRVQVRYAGKTTDIIVKPMPDREKLEKKLSTTSLIDLIKSTRGIEPRSELKEQAPGRFHQELVEEGQENHDER